MLLGIIKEWCETNKVSIAKLEEMAKIGNGTISNWGTKTPSVSSLHKLHQTTGIDMAKLVDAASKIEEEKYEKK